ncbi:hypothetical protein [Microbacterium sp. G2-8]|uniref:hypothetical protein n=1 Tax=Microbacterium sp. G2-8 TaxID=2842454 RepID=UPI001C8AAE69|nr:hypothetical protein [Microbacterium sp. G2-8]
MDQMMMDTMPNSMKSMPGMDMMDMSVMQACMDACSAVEQAATICATQDMDCAPACMTCADMSHTMMRSMLRMQGMTPAAMMAMLDACMAVCQMCMDECASHTDNDVCRMCAQACQACMDSCMAVKDMMMASA